MEPKLWGMNMGVNEETIYMITQYMEHRHEVEHEEAFMNPPVQSPFSMWAIEEIIDYLREDYTSYPDEVIRKFISLMDKYEAAAEPERKSLFRIAKNTAKDLYSYLFEGNNVVKESIPF